jgi:hypothetical protein
MANSPATGRAALGRPNGSEELVDLQLEAVAFARRIAIPDLAEVDAAARLLTTNPRGRPLPRVQFAFRLRALVFRLGAAFEQENQ